MRIPKISIEYHLSQFNRSSLTMLLSDGDKISIEYYLS